MNNFKILTDISEHRSESIWHKKVDFRPEAMGGNGFFSTLTAILWLLKNYGKYDALILTSNRTGNFFGMILGLLPLKKKPFLMVDCLWYIPKNRLWYFVKKFQYRFVARAVDKFVVWASHETHDYAKAFNIPTKQFLYIPHHHTLEGFQFDIRDGDYIFSGGDGDRDYPTLLKAVEGLNIKVFIATRNVNWNCNHPVPSNVTATPTTSSEFRELMAGSRIVVVPMKKGLLHSGGQQTYLNAMALGKAVIVADKRGGKDYIHNGINGILVSKGNHQEMRHAIVSVLENECFEQTIRNNAKNSIKLFSTPRCMERILESITKVK